MAVLRRVVVPLVLMAATTALLRLNGNTASPRRVGGWRTLSAPSYR